MKTLSEELRDVRGNGFVIRIKTDDKGSTIVFEHGRRNTSDYLERKFQVDMPSVARVFLTVCQQEVAETPIGTEGSSFKISRSKIGRADKVAIAFSEGDDRETVVELWFRDFKSACYRLIRQWR